MWEPSPSKAYQKGILEVTPTVSPADSGKEPGEVHGLDVVPRDTADLEGTCRHEVLIRQFQNTWVRHPIKGTHRPDHGKECEHGKPCKGRRGIDDCPRKSENGQRVKKQTRDQSQRAQDNEEKAELEDGSEDYWQAWPWSLIDFDRWNTDIHHVVFVNGRCPTLAYGHLSKISKMLNSFFTHVCSTNACDSNPGGLPPPILILTPL